MKKITALFTALLICISLAIPAFSYSESIDGTIDQSQDYSDVPSMYKYNFIIDLYNPCNSNDMDRDAVNVFKFTFTYLDKNGCGSKKTYTFDMSWNGKQNRNSEFLKKNFIRSNDNDYKVGFSLWVPGHVQKLNILLNMDGGERLGFRVKEVYCNGTRVNSTSDYVSSAYSDSKAEIGFSMPKSYPVSINKADTDTTDNRDQYGVLIDSSVAEKILSNFDGEINQYLDHSAEKSMYRYKLDFNVENPVNMADADIDAVEEFSITFTYTDQNGYGKDHKYVLDMSWSGGRNLNASFLNVFQALNDNAYRTSFYVWVPGIVKKVDIHLNMAGNERLTIDLDSVSVNGYRANIDTDYVSSSVTDSDATVKCFLPGAKVIAKNGTLYDCYGALAGSKLKEMYDSNNKKYTYHG